MAAQAGQIIFEDFTEKVNKQIADEVLKWLEEAGAELESEVATRTKIGKYTGQIADKWTHVVDTSEFSCIVGNPMENAIWEEFGTGEYAFNGDGRQDTPWPYPKDLNGEEWGWTFGKKPRRCLHHTFMNNEEMLKDVLKQRLKGMK